MVETSPADALQNPQRSDSMENETANPELPSGKPEPEPVLEAREEPAAAPTPGPQPVGEELGNEETVTPTPEPEPVAEVVVAEEPAAPTPEPEPVAEEAAAATPEPAQAELGQEKAPAEPAPPPVATDAKHWYVVKVQSGREESIKSAVERRVKIEGLQEYYGEIIIPTEKYTDMVRGKRVVKERKLYPGYLMVNVEYNDRILYLFRETSGVGDFVGGGFNKAPQPMSPDEIARMRGRTGEEIAPGAAPKPKFDKGDRVKVKDGTFAGMEGEVKELLEGKGAVRVELTIFGRPVPVELEYWQVDNV